MAKKKNEITLAEGQIWALPKGFMEIASVGKTFVSYRTCQHPRQHKRPGEGKMDDVVEMLQKNEAKLMKDWADAEVNRKHVDTLINDCAISEDKRKRK